MKFESSANLPKRSGAQEVADQAKSRSIIFKDLQGSIDSQLLEIQGMLQRVQDYETAQGSFGDWLEEYIQTVQSIESFACTTEGINTELAKIKVAQFLIV